MQQDNKGGRRKAVLPPWKRAAKQRLRDLARQHADPDRPGDKGQRQLARLWLDDAGKAAQINQWCSKRSTFPEPAALVLLRERLGVSLDWLLSAETKVPTDAGRVLRASLWPTDRVAALAEEFGAYIAGVLWDHHSEQVRPGVFKSRRPYAAGVEPHHVFDAMHGDALSYAAQQARALFDQMADTAEREQDAADAEQWREFKRLLLRDTTKPEDAGKAFRLVSTDTIPATAQQAVALLRRTQEEE